MFAECMARVLDATGNLDVQMGIENHGIQGNQPEFLTHVIEKVGSPQLGMTIDTANFYWYGHPLSRVYDIIKQLAPKAKHTHIKNINYPADVREVQREIGWKYNDFVCPLREGDIDLKAVVSILKDAGYEGDLCIEDESLMRWDNEKRKAVLIDDAAYLKEILS